MGVFRQVPGAACMHARMVRARSRASYITGGSLTVVSVG
jgi:hypothetical protein